MFRLRNKKINFPVCSATETSKKIEISHVASLDMILSNKRIIKVLIRFKQDGLPLCCLQTPKDRFSPIEAHLIAWV